MQYSSIVLSLSALAAAGLAMAQTTLTINTPAVLIQCQPAAIAWSGGTAPYFPAVTAGGDIATILQSFDQTSSTSLTWTVNVASGTAVTLYVTDSTGTSAASSQVTITAGSSSCLGSTSSGSGSSTSAGSSSSAASSSSSSSRASSSSAASSSSSASRTSSSSAAGTTTSSAAATASSSAASSGAESIRGFYAVVAGFVGVGAAALF